MKFRTAYDHPFVKPVVEYPLLQKEYRMEFDEESGQEKLVAVGTVNLQAIKQEAAIECSIYRQIDRFNRSGDDSFLGETVEGFIDAMSLPKSLMEIENIRSKATQLWSQAPLEIRNKYGSNLGLFLKDVDKRLSDRAAAKEAKKRSEVVGGSVNE